MPTIYRRASFKMVDTLSLYPPYEAVHRELICLARKRNFMQRPATNWHDGQITSDFPKSCQARESKIFRFRFHPNQPHNSARLTQMRGVGHRHERAVRCDGRRRCARRTRLTRTAKSCGSGAAVLALSPREAKILGMTEAKEPFSGESTK